MILIITTFIIVFIFIISIYYTNTIQKKAEKITTHSNVEHLNSDYHLNQDDDTNLKLLLDEKGLFKSLRGKSSDEYLKQFIKNSDNKADLSSWAFLKDMVEENRKKNAGTDAPTSTSPAGTATGADADANTSELDLLFTLLSDSLFPTTTTPTTPTTPTSQASSAEDIQRDIVVKELKVRDIVDSIINSVDDSDNSIDIPPELSPSSNYPTISKKDVIDYLNTYDVYEASNSIPYEYKNDKDSNNEEWKLENPKQFEYITDEDYPDKEDEEYYKKSAEAYKKDQKDHNEILTLINDIELTKQKWLYTNKCQKFLEEPFLSDFKPAYHNYMIYAFTSVLKYLPSVEKPQDLTLIELEAYKLILQKMPNCDDLVNMFGNDLDSLNCNLDKIKTQKPKKTYKLLEIKKQTKNKKTDKDKDKDKDKNNQGTTTTGTPTTTSMVGNTANKGYISPNDIKAYDPLEDQCQVMYSLKNMTHVKKK